jgi:hypothetical protein
MNRRESAAMDDDRTPATTPGQTNAKPPKPWPGFPLYWHQRGYWMCKRRGQERRYTADATESYEQFVLDESADRKGEDLEQQRKRYLLKDAVNLYLTRQKKRFEDGELSGVQFAKCRFELERKLPRAVPLSTPLDGFRAKFAGDMGPAKLFGAIRSQAVKRGLEVAHRHVTIVRAALDNAAKKKLMLPPDYADDFDPPSPAAMDKVRNALDLKHGERRWTVDELRRIIAECERIGADRRGKRKNAVRKNPHLLAQVMLALFAGFGSDDCSALHERALLRDVGMVKFPRVKNGRPRLAALPPVAWAAIDASLAERRTPAGDAERGLVFLTYGGRRCNAAKAKSDEKGLVAVGRNDTIAQNFKRLLQRLDLTRFRAGFKTLRAMARTLMVGAGVDADLIAVVMGRKFRHTVDEYYLRGELRAELFKLAGHVESQLFPKPTNRAAKRTR